MTKMTYANAIDVMFAIANGKAVEDAVKDEAIARMADLKGQLAKRNGSGKKGLTKTQKDNIEIKNHIYEVLEAEPDGLTATEIGNKFGLTCQRASGLLAQMGDPNGKIAGDGRVRKEKVGKQMKFFIAEPGFYDEVADEAVEGE